MFVLIAIAFLLLSSTVMASVSFCNLSLFFSNNIFTNTFSRMSFHTARLHSVKYILERRNLRAIREFLANVMVRIANVLRCVDVISFTSFPCSIVALSFCVDMSNKKDSFVSNILRPSCLRCLSETVRQCCQDKRVILMPSWRMIDRSSTRFVCSCVFVRSSTAALTTIFRCISNFATRSSSRLRWFMSRTYTIHDLRPFRNNSMDHLDSIAFIRWQHLILFST